MSTLTKCAVGSTSEPSSVRECDEGVGLQALQHGLAALIGPGREPRDDGVGHYVLEGSECQEARDGDGDANHRPGVGSRWLNHAFTLRQKTQGDWRGHGAASRLI